MSVILKALFSSIVSGIMDWWNAEQAESAKWAAESRKQQLNSIKIGQEKEREYNDALSDACKNASSSGSLWNAKLITLLIVLPFLTGCFRFYVYTEPYRPVPPKIERPTLEDTSAFNEREQALASYAEQLESVYNKIRSDAIAANEKNGYPTPGE